MPEAMIERNHEVVDAYDAGNSYADTGALFGISGARVRQIVHNYRRRGIRKDDARRTDLSPRAFNTIQYSLGLGPDWTPEDLQKIDRATLKATPGCGKGTFLEIVKYMGKEWPWPDGEAVEEKTVKIGDVSGEPVVMKATLVTTLKDIQVALEGRESNHDNSLLCAKTEFGFIYTTVGEMRVAQRVYEAIAANKEGVLFDESD